MLSHEDSSQILSVIAELGKAQDRALTAYRQANAELIGLQGMIKQLAEEEGVEGNNAASSLGGVILRLRSERQGLRQQIQLVSDQRDELEKERDSQLISLDDDVVSMRSVPADVEINTGPDSEGRPVINDMG